MRSITSNLKLQLKKKLKHPVRKEALIAVVIWTFSPLHGVIRFHPRIYNIEIPNVSIQFHLSSFAYTFCYCFFSYFESIQNRTAPLRLMITNFVCDCIWFRFVTAALVLFHFICTLTQYDLCNWFDSIPVWKEAGEMSRWKCRNDLLKYILKINARKFHPNPIKKWNDKHPN